jgi:DNA-binding NarL/FixJ family response regulator
LILLIATSSSLNKSIAVRDVAQEAVPKPGATARRKILLVDDQPIFRHGLQELIDGQSDLMVCGQTDHAPPALKLMRKLKPDLAIIDVSLHGTIGIGLIKMIKAEDLPILVLSMHDETLYALRALKAGALGCVMKAEALEHVIAGIRRALEGRIFVSPHLDEHLIFRAVKFLETGAGTPVDQLSDRELEVLALLVNATTPDRLRRP